MSTSPITTSAQPAQSAESTAVVERSDATTVEKTNGLFLEILQLMQAFGITSLDGYNVTQITDGQSIFILGENEFGDEFCFAVVTDTEPVEETEQTLVIEEVDAEEAVAIAADVTPGPVLVAS
jgi:hypothetical protein